MNDASIFDEALGAGAEAIGGEPRLHREPVPGGLVDRLGRLGGERRQVCSALELAVA